MSIINSSRFQRLTDRRITQVLEEEAKRQDLKSMIPMFYGVESSKEAYEESTYVTGFGDIGEFNGKLTYLTAYPGWHKKVEHKEFAGAAQIERKFFDDKLFGVFDKVGGSLARSMARTKEKYAVRMFNNCTSTAFDFMTSEEGKPLCSSSHLTRAAGVSTASGFDNTSTLALTKSNLATVRLKARLFRTDIGERYEGWNNIGIVVPDALADTAREIVGSEKDPTSANNTINPHYQRYTIIPYLRLDDNDTNNWGIIDLDTAKESFKWLDRIKPETKSTVDFDSYAFLYAIYARWSYMFNDWRCILWSTVS